MVVIGAGAAGIAAAAGLLRFGSDLKIAVLEARNYTGGRVHARAFGAHGRVVIEEGANWVHGEPPPGGAARMENPVWALAQRAGLATVRIPGSCANTSGYALYEADGALRAPVNGAPQRRADAAFACANATGARLGPGPAHDVSFAAALAGCGFPAPPAQGSTDDALYFEMTAANYPLPVAEESLKWAIPDPTYEYFGTDDHFVHDQRARGYAAALDALLRAGAGGAARDVTREFEQALHLNAAARRKFAEHPIATKALRCTATAWNLIAAQCSVIP